jgi:uncharacterized membrane protein
MLGVITDTTGFLISAGLIALYHLYVLIRLRRMPMYTTQAVNHAVRAKWVKFVKADESRAVLAIQTLRNSTMAATFLASTAVLLMIGTLNLMEQADQLSGILTAAGVPGAGTSNVWVTKVLFLVTVYFVAFFCFAMSVRLYNHVGYQVNVPAEPEEESHDFSYVTRQLKSAGRYYTLGMRAYYFSVPLVFWIFGAHLMVLTSVILVIVLFINDRAPEMRKPKTKKVRK